MMGAKDFDLQNLRRPLVAVLGLAAVLLATGCARKSASEITGQFAPLLQMRDQAVADVAAGKASLDPASVGQLGICYGDLRSKSDQYTQFIAGIVQSSSFDSAQNQSDARTLGVAIASYNDCLLKLQKVAASKSATPSLSQVDADWVPAFGRAVEAYWARDGANVDLLSPDARASVVEQIKSAAMWPDFAAIGGGSPVPLPSPISSP
jgi:hypothetical protein